MCGSGDVGLVAWADSFWLRLGRAATVLVGNIKSQNLIYSTPKP
jgi:hypothetical protein